MKRILSALVLALTLAAAAFAVGGWPRHAKHPAGCDKPSRSELPITAALHAWRCSDASDSGGANLLH